MSIVVDPEAEYVSTDAEDTQNQSAQTVDAAPSEDDNLPEKLRGKSKAELAAIYSNLETELGRARNEIGTTRRIVDELLQLRPRATEKSKVDDQPLTPLDLAERPEESIVRVAERVADHKVAAHLERLDRIEASLTDQAITRKHGDYRATLSTPQFQEWALKSPYRVGLIEKAARGDMVAGDEILSLYKEHVPQTAAPAEKGGASLEQAAKATTVKSGGSGANKVTPSSGGGKKVYSRKELKDLYIHDPEEYNRLSDSGELMLAYREKRVR